MNLSGNNVIPFPLNRRPSLKVCPQCGCTSDVLRLGRLLWGYCDAHGTRWVVADLEDSARQRIDRKQLRRGLELLANYVEISH